MKNTKEVNKFINHAQTLLEGLKPSRYSELLSVPKELAKENYSLAVSCGHITMNLMPEYIELVPLTKEDAEAYAIYLELLRQVLLER